MAKKKRRKSTTKKGIAPKRPKWCSAFLAAYRISGVVRIAAEAAKIDRSRVFRYAKENPEFKAEWDDASEDAADTLEEEARRRAHDGVRRLKFHQGTPCMIPAVGDDGKVVKDGKGEVLMIPYVEHEYSDTLLIFLLKGLKPQKYREKFDHQHTGKDGGPIETSGKLIIEEFIVTSAAEEPAPDGSSSP